MQQINEEENDKEGERDERKKKSKLTTSCK
jgi:hypothetical protein